MYFDPEYCEQENTLLNKYKRLKIILSPFKKMFYDDYIYDDYIYDDYKLSHA